MLRLVQRVVVSSIVGVLVASIAACGPTTFYVQGIKIDTDQHVIPVGHKFLSHPNSDSYYMFSYTATKLTIVNHFAKQAGSQGVHELIYLEAYRGRLERTVKVDQVSTGSFGALVVRRTCFYNRPNSSSLDVLIQSTHPEIGREIPESIGGLPTDAPPLTSMSIVRIFARDSGQSFAVGNYEADGELGSINSGSVENETVQPGASIMMATARDFDKLRGAFGLPPSPSVRDYLRTNRMPLLKTTQSEERAFVILVYGFGRFIRQDSLQNGVVTSSTYLKPVATDEESVLGAECDARFQRQISASRPTAH